MAKRKLTLVIDIDTKNLMQDEKTIPSFWIGYISACAGHQVVSSQYEEEE